MTPTSDEFLKLARKVIENLAGTRAFTLEVKDMGPTRGGRCALTGDDWAIINLHSGLTLGFTLHALLHETAHLALHREILRSAPRSYGNESIQDPVAEAEAEALAGEWEFRAKAAVLPRCLGASPSTLFRELLVFLGEMK